MPYKSKYPCGNPQCPKLISNGRFCEEHATENNKIYNQQRNPIINKMYASQRWQRLRKLKLARNPLCELCLAEKITTAASIVHHKHEVSAGGDFWDFKNLQSVCTACHNKVHARGAIRENNNKRGKK